MSHPTTPRAGGPETETVSDDANVERILTALEDEGCREIIRATRCQARSASELADACELPLSTVYRKLDNLTAVGLLEEEVRLCRSGQHTNEYRVAVEGIQISLDPESGVELRIATEPSAEVDSSLIAGAD